MSKLVDSYRRTHPQAASAQPPSRLKPGWMLGALIAAVTAVILLTGGLWLPNTSVPVPEAGAIHLRPSAQADGLTGDPVTTGSTLQQSIAAYSSRSETLSNSGSWLYVLGVGAGTWLVVYVSLSLLMRNRRKQGRTDRAPAHHVADNADERRWNGGPIRN